MFTPKDIWWTKCQIFLLLLLVTSTELCIKYCWCWFQMSLIVRSKDNDKSRQHAPSWHKPWGLGKHMLECLWSTWQSICEQGCHWEWWKVIGEVVKPLVRQITTYFGSHLGIVGVVQWNCTIWYSLIWYMVGQEISYYGSDHAIHKLVRAHVLLPFFSFWDPFWTQLFHKTFQWFLTQQNFKRWSQWLRSSPTLFIIFSVCELGSIKPWGWIWDPGIWAVPGSMTSNPGIAGFDASELQSVRSFINICDQLFPSFWVLQVVLLFVCQLWSIQTDLLLWSNCCF